jgi:hypothetical protein
LEIGMKIAGIVITVVIVLFMIGDAVSHILKPAMVVDAFNQLGFPVALGVEIAVLALVATALYAIPPTQVLGAIMLTGYLGGACAIQVRVGNPPFEQLFSVIVGILVWAALYLRDPRIRALIPLSSRSGSG